MCNVYIGLVRKPIIVNLIVTLQKFAKCVNIV